MAKYRKKPVVIEAFRLGYDMEPSWFKVALSAELANYSDDRIDVKIKTLEGDMHAEHGAWIILGIQAEIYPCKHDIFMATYEKAG